MDTGDEKTTTGPRSATETGTEAQMGTKPKVDIETETEMYMRQKRNTGTGKRGTIMAAIGAERGS